MEQHQDEPSFDGAAPRNEAVPAAGPAFQAAGRDRYLDTLRALALARVVVVPQLRGRLAEPRVPLNGRHVRLGRVAHGPITKPACLGSDEKPGQTAAAPTLGLCPHRVGPALYRRLAALAGGRRFLAQNSPVVRSSQNPPFPETIGPDNGPVDATWGVQAEEILWYIRAYFWFMLLSPLLLKAFRRSPWITLLAPLGLLAALVLGNMELPDWANSPVTDFATFGSCWILGFAHHDGLLRKLRLPLVTALAVAAMGMGLAWVVTHLADGGWDLNDIPLAQALWSLGFCAVLMRLSPVWGTLPGPMQILNGAITLMNNRAMTIYLWHNLLLVGAVLLIDLGSENDTISEAFPWLFDGNWMPFFLVWPLLGITILGVGWVEDIAAGRTPRIWPARSWKPARTPAEKRSTKIDHQLQGTQGGSFETSRDT